MADEFPQSPKGWGERADGFLDVAEKPETADIFDQHGAELLEVRTLNDARLARPALRLNQGEDGGGAHRASELTGVFHRMAPEPKDIFGLQQG